jgi:hypothetical protein
MRASTLDGVFAIIFSNITGGILLINFLLNLGATPVEIGLLLEVASVERPSQYFVIAAAVIGVSGGLGSATGGFLAGLDFIGGLTGLFALSGFLRLIALLPLVFVREPRSQPVIQVMLNLVRPKPNPALVTAVNYPPLS